MYRDRRVTLTEATATVWNCQAHFTLLYFKLIVTAIFIRRACTTILTILTVLYNCYTTNKFLAGSACCSQTFPDCHGKSIEQKKETTKMERRTKKSRAYSVWEKKANQPSSVSIVKASMSQKNNEAFGEWKVNRIWRHSRRTIRRSAPWMDGIELCARPWHPMVKPSIENGNLI